MPQGTNRPAALLKPGGTLDQFAIPFQGLFLNPLFLIEEGMDGMPADQFEELDNGLLGMEGGRLVGFRHQAEADTGQHTDSGVGGFVG